MIEAYLAGEVPLEVLNDWLADQGEGPIVVCPQQHAPRRREVHGTTTFSRTDESRFVRVSRSGRGAWFYENGYFTREMFITAYRRSLSTTGHPRGIRGRVSRSRSESGSRGSFGFCSRSNGHFPYDRHELRGRSW